MDNQKIYRPYALHLILLLSAILLINSCGGGSGSDYSPPGNSPGAPHTLQLYPEKTVVQTSLYAYLRAKLVDGNGDPIKGAVINFTNESIVGSFSSASLTQASAYTTAVTDSTGVASIRIRSTTSGFATIVAEHSGLRDRKSVYFTSSDSIIPEVPACPAPVLTLEVDGNGNEEYNETDDLIILQDSGDDTIQIRATLTLDGMPVSYVAVTFEADYPDFTFPGGSDTDSDGITDQKISYTDSSGQAFAISQVLPSGITKLETVANLMASSIFPYNYSSSCQSFEAASMISVFLEPVTIADIELFADPLFVSSGGTSTISALVTTSAGTPVPDGTTVNFYVTSGTGSVTPFAQTTDGIAEATFKAPTLTAGSFGEVDDITAKVNSIQDTIRITVSAPPAEPVEPEPLIVIPASASACPGDVIPFLISGGTGSYTTTSSDRSRVCYDSNGNQECTDTGDKGIWYGSSVSATVDKDASAGDVTLNVYDSEANTKTATITILSGCP